MLRRKPTILDVAKAAKVSSATVSRVVNGDERVLEATRTRVTDAIERLGYRHNAIARSLVTGRSGILGVVIPDVAGPLYAQMARGIEDVLEPHGMHLAMVTCDRDADKEAALISLLLSRKVEGLVLIGSLLGVTHLRALLDDDTALALMQREAPAEPGPYTDLSLDNEGGTRRALDHLMRAGHDHIAHVAGVRRDGEERLASYRRWLAERDLPELVIPSDSTEAGGLAAWPQLRDHPEFTAVYCSNDRVALGLYRALALDGKRVPDHLSVVGFDDLPVCAYLDPPLTTVRQDGRAMGRAAALDVLRQIAGDPLPHPAVLEAQLVERDSVARPRSARVDRVARRGGTPS